MEAHIDAHSEGDDIALRLDSLPSTCPICHTGIDPRFRFAYLHADLHKLEVLFQCPRTECHRTFITYYLTPQIRNPTGGLYHMLHSLPEHFEGRTFSKIIESISESFITIFNQSLEAEHEKLTEIAGPGYRKAL